MNPIAATYNRLTVIAAGLAVFVNTVVIRFGEPIARAHLGEGTLVGSFALFLLSLSAVYTTAYALPLLLYKHALWRILFRRFVFDGYWHMTITYDACEKARHPGDSLPPIPLPFSYTSAVRIVQDAFSIRFESGHSRPNERLTARTVALVGEGLEYIYEVERSLPSGSPLASKVLSVGVLSATRREFGRPVEGMSMLYHCCLPDQPLYRGHAQWKRLTRREYNKLLRHLEADDHFNAGPRPLGVASPRAIDASVATKGTLPADR